MSKEYQIRSLIQLIWKQLPSGASTFSQCQNDKCEESARGGKKCIKCLEKELARFVGEEAAQNYVDAAHVIRAMEREMLEGEV